MKKRLRHYKKNRYKQKITYRNYLLNIKLQTIEIIANVSCFTTQCGSNTSNNQHRHILPTYALLLSNLKPFVSVFASILFKEAISCNLSSNHPHPRRQSPRRWWRQDRLPAAGTCHTCRRRGRASWEPSVANDGCARDDTRPDRICRSLHLAWCREALGPPVGCQNAGTRHSRLVRSCDLWTTAVHRALNPHYPERCRRLMRLNLVKFGTLKTILRDVFCNTFIHFIVNSVDEFVYLDSLVIW